MTKDEALRMALEALEAHADIGIKSDKAITAIKEILANVHASDTSQERVNETAKQRHAQEPVANMPSNTRYTVEVEGHGRTYWDNIHDAITCAQRAVYSGPENTTRALDDLKAGQLAEWSYGFSAVRIYPPQNTTSPARKPLTDEFILNEVLALGTAEFTTICGPREILLFARAIEAAHGIKE